MHYGLPSISIDTFKKLNGIHEFTWEKEGNIEKKKSNEKYVSIWGKRKNFINNYTFRLLFCVIPFICHLSKEIDSIFYHSTQCVNVNVCFQVVQKKMVKKHLFLESKKKKFNSENSAQIKNLKINFNFGFDSMKSIHELNY